MARTWAVLIGGSLCCELVYGQAGGPRPRGVAPNPGGAVVITNSTTATIGYVDTPVTQRVDNYSLTLIAKRNGNQVFSQTFSSPITDPTVQAAIAQADGILSNAGATFGTPVLTSNSSQLQSSVTAPPPTYTCLTVTTGATGATTVTTSNTFGPATVAVGDCQSDTFTVLSEQLDININVDFVYAIPRNVVTTNTYLNTQTYVITGTGGAASVPAVSDAGLTGLTRLLIVAAVWRSRSRQAG